MVFHGWTCHHLPCWSPRTLRVTEDRGKFSQGATEDKTQCVPPGVTVWNPNSEYDDYIRTQLILLTHTCVSTCLRWEWRWKKAAQPTRQVSEPLVTAARERLSQPFPDRSEHKSGRLTETTKSSLGLFLPQKSWVFHMHIKQQHQTQLHFTIIDLPNSWVLKTNDWSINQRKKKSGSAYYLPHL